jgi:hypothetical protein
MEVDTEGVGARPAAGPAAVKQLVLGDHRLARFDQQAGEAFFDGRELHPRPPKQEAAVAVDTGDSDGVLGPPPEPVETSPDVTIVARQPDPILEVVASLRGIGGRCDEQQSRHPEVGEALELISFFRPLKDHDVGHVKWLRRRVRRFGSA